MSTLTKSQRFALANVLTDWDESLTYSEVLDKVFEGTDDDAVVIWEAYEDMSPVDVHERIVRLEQDFRTYAAQVTAYLREAIEEGDPMTIAERLASLENQLGV